MATGPPSSHTLNDSQAWLEVDLQSVRSIDIVSLLQRTDCCQDRLANFYVLVSDVPFTSADLATTLAQPGVGSYYFNGPGGAQPNFIIGRTGRYVRVQLSGQNYLHLVKLQVFDNSDGTDVALDSRGGVPSASSTYNGFYESYANDGNRAYGGYWNNANAYVLPDWWQVQMPLSQRISAVNVFTLEDSPQASTEPTLADLFTTDGIPDFDVQYWTGSAWANVPGGHITGNNHVWTQIAFAPVTTDRIRVVVNGALNAYARIWEVEAVTTSPVGIVNGSFEVPPLGVDIDRGDGSGWTMAPGAGITKNNSGLTSGNPSTSAGGQVLFLQLGGTVEQSVTLDAGSYALRYRAAQRGNYQLGSQVLQASIDGIVIDTFQPVGTNYTNHVVPFSVASGGTHTLRLAGVGGGGSDYTAFVDDVKVTPPPPPAALIAHYRFEDAAWNGSAGEVADSSGSGHPASAAGSPFPTPSVSNPAINANPGTCAAAFFPGPYNGGGILQVHGLPVSTTNGDATSVSFWMYWNGDYDMFPLGFNGYYLWIAWTSIGFNVNGTRQYGADWTGLANGWHHVVAIFTNGNDLDNEIWIDGVSRGLSDRSGGVPANGTVGSDFAIGGIPGRTDRLFRYGMLDEVKVYNGRLTPAQVAADLSARHACAVATDPGNFNAFETSTASGAITGVVHTKVSGTSFGLDVVALNSAGTDVLPFFAGDVKVELVDARDSSGAVSGSCRSSWIPLAGSTPVTLTFTGSGTARMPATLAEPDAWRDVRVRLSYPATGTPTSIGCSSDDFAIRPQSLAGLATTDADASSAGGTRSLTNTGTTGGVVHKAGQPFTVSAVAVNAIAATASHYDGAPIATVVPCNGSACLLGWTTVAYEYGTFTVPGRRLVRYGANPNWAYQLASGSVSCDNGSFGDPYSGVYKHCEMSGAALGAFAMPSSAFTAGVLAAPATYAEAGAFSLVLVDSSWAAVDAADGSTDAERTVASATVDVGRFVPDHFELTSLAAPTLRTFDSSSCAARSFTYVGQPFG